MKRHLAGDEADLEVLLADLAGEDWQEACHQLTDVLVDNPEGTMMEKFIAFLSVREEEWVLLPLNCLRAIQADLAGDSTAVIEAYAALGRRRFFDEKSLNCIALLAGDHYLRLGNREAAAKALEQCRHDDLAAQLALFTFAGELPATPLGKCLAAYRQDDLEAFIKNQGEFHPRIAYHLGRLREILWLRALEAFLRESDRPIPINVLCLHAYVDDYECIRLIRLLLREGKLQGKLDLVDLRYIPSDEAQIARDNLFRKLNLV